MSYLRTYEVDIMNLFCKMQLTTKMKAANENIMKVQKEIPIYKFKINMYFIDIVHKVVDCLGFWHGTFEISFWHVHFGTSHKFEMPKGSM